MSTGFPLDNRKYYISLSLQDKSTFGTHIESLINKKLGNIVDIYYLGIRDDLSNYKRQEVMTEKIINMNVKYNNKKREDFIVTKVLPENTKE
jgi:hypothetical protein